MTEGRGRAYLLLAAAAALPRLVVLLHERASIWQFNEKSDVFALTFVRHGTFGFVPGEPSAYTQPLYGFFLVPLYWVFGHAWWAVGLAQTAVAVATAWVVYEIGRRVASPRVAILGALIATLHPYLVWHDVHVNREILDQLVGAVAVLLTLVAVERRSALWGAALGLVLGLAVLGNSRLVVLPVVLGVFVAWQLGRTRLAPVAAGAIVLGAAVAVSPWLVRNEVQLGCLAITTDARALWKANNLRTYDLVARGLWIDYVPDLPDAPPSPADAYERWLRTGRVEHVDECGFQRFYEHRVTEFWREHPGAKARLMGQATALLWDPRVRAFEGNPGAGGRLDTARTLAEGIYMGAVFALALVGLFLVRRTFAWLALTLLAYETAAAAVFAGQTRYRVAWDFVLALLAAAALEWLWRIARRSSHER